MANDVMPAFDELYATYSGRLYGFVIAVFGRPEAEDIVQEAMLRAYASYAGFDRSRDPWPWLVAIVRNVVRDRRARIEAVPMADVPSVVAHDTTDVEERQLVRAALQRLSASDRDVLVLRECDELTFGELSRLFGRSPNTLRQQVFRARRRLAEAYTALGGRALSLAGALGRWWRDAPAQVAAAAVVGTLVGGMPATPPPQHGVAAGPAVRGGAPTGPATGHAIPARPLQPRRATRVVVAPTTSLRHAESAVHERPPSAPPDETSVVTPDGRTGYGTRDSWHGETVHCLVLGSASPLGCRTRQ